MTNEMTKNEADDQLETSEELQRQLSEIQARLSKAIAREDEEDSVERIEYPLADIVLCVGKTGEITKKSVTPAEVALLAAMHHEFSGGNPIRGIKLHKETASIDPITLKRHLVNLYGGVKVNRMFPGPVPNFPKKFRRAIQMGTETKITPERLLDFHVEPMNAAS